MFKGLFGGKKSAADKPAADKSKSAFKGLFAGKKSAEDKSKSANTKKKGAYFLELNEADAKQPAPAQVETHVETAPVAAATAALAPVEGASADSKAAKKANLKSAKPAKAAKAPKAAKASKTKAPAPAVPALPVRVEPTEVEFATKFSITPTLSRRRPGPSLNVFKDMASQMRTPRSSR